MQISVRRWLLFGLILLFSIQPEPSATAQQTCTTLARLEAVLDNSDEHLIAVGISKQDYQMKFYASPENQTWTLLAVDAGGIACVLAVGDSFDLVPLPPKGPKS